MKCRYCGKNVKSIAHFMQAHKALMLRKMRKGRGRGRRSRGKASRSRSEGRGHVLSTGGHSRARITFYD